MKRNSRLSLALHTLGHMADEPDRLRTSSDIAEHAGTNPVVVRRVLGKLREAGLLISEKGHAGGWRLARDPDNVTLADVYVALDESMVAGDPHEYAAECSIEKSLQTRVSEVLSDIEQALIAKLHETSIAEVNRS